LGDVFLVDLDPPAALKVAKRVFRTGFVLVKPPNMEVQRAHEEYSGQNRSFDRLNPPWLDEIDANQSGACHVVARGAGKNSSIENLPFYIGAFLELVTLTLVCRSILL
jgi:hypothetical protein